MTGEDHLTDSRFKEFGAVLPPADSNTGKIRNGLYALSVEVQDGVKGGDNGVVVLRDGTIRGGDLFFYFIGS